MLKISLLVSFYILSYSAFGQNLTLDQVISLRPKSIAYIEEYLTAKNWELIEAVNKTDENRGYTTFAYGKTEYEDKASSFLSTYFGNDSNVTNRLSIQINSLLIYNTFIARMKVLGYKLSGSKIDDGIILKIYKGDYSVIQVKTQAFKDDSELSTKTTYHFLITTLSDYEQNFGE